MTHGHLARRVHAVEHHRYVGFLAQPDDCSGDRSRGHILQRKVHPAALFSRAEADAHGFTHHDRAWVQAGLVPFVPGLAPARGVAPFSTRSMSPADSMRTSLAGGSLLAHTTYSPAGSP